MAKKIAKAPVEWVDGKIVLGAPPENPLSGRGNKRLSYNDFRLNLGFEVSKSLFQSFFNLLDERHKTKIWVNRSKISFISPEAVTLLKNNVFFFEEKYKEKEVEKQELVSIGLETLKKASAKAGVSLKELNQKLERLSTLAKGKDLDLAIRMVADFDDVWLFESLLAGSTIDKEGYLVPGKPLKMFKDHAEFFGILALVNTPEGTNLHASLNKIKLQYFKIIKNDFELFDLYVKHIIKKYPTLRTKGKIKFYCNLKSLSDTAARALSKHEGELRLEDLVSLSDFPGHVALAKKLAGQEKFLRLDNLKSLSDAAAFGA